MISSTKHLGKLLTELRQITGGDATKAKQLSDLLYSRVHAGEERRVNNVTKIVEHRRDLAEAITSSLREFVHALHDAGGKGRYPGKVRDAQQVIATAVSRAAHYTKTSYKEIGDALGLDSRMIGKCALRFDELANDGNWEQLYDDRGAQRSDTTPKEWLDFALLYWTNQELGFVRESEVARDTIRNPDDKSDKLPYRKCYLQKGIHEGHAEMLKAGKACFGEKFHMSYTYFVDLRPFFVKDETRDTCVCVYHMRWKEFANGIFNYRHSMRSKGISSCNCSIAPNEKALRRQLVCPRAPNATHDNIPCFLNRCLACHDARRLFEGPGSLCADEIRDHGNPEGKPATLVKLEMYEKVSYTCKDGTVKEKKDFVSKELPFSEFKTAVIKYWPKFIAHDNDARWHDADFNALKDQLPCGAVGLVIDYAENFSHEPRVEHQSKYFSQVQTTIVPVVLMFRVEDLTNITEERRGELIDYFDAHELPHVISETHFVISADMQHDSTFIHKLMDDHILPYIKAIAPTVTTIHGRSDGCKAQFKCAAHFDWVSKQSKDGCRLTINWSFFESCHGKCFCDPEGGTLKNAARRWELHGHEGEKACAHILKTSWDFFVWARDESGLATPVKALEQKHGRGIFRRFFYWIPAKGVGAVDRSRLPKFSSAKGSSRLHEFVDIGVPGTVSTRRAACHQCEACWAGRRDECAHRDYCGGPQRLVISRDAVPAAAAQRMERATLNRDATARAEGAKVGTMVCIETHRDEQTFPWVIGSVVTELQSAPAASPAYDPEKDAVHFDLVRFGEPALQVCIVACTVSCVRPYNLAPMLICFVQHISLPFGCSCLAGAIV